MQYVVISRRVPRYLVGLGVLGIGVVLAIAFVGVHRGSAAASTSPLVVKMLDMPATFQPAKLSIRVGETVQPEKNQFDGVKGASS